MKGKCLHVTGLACLILLSACTPQTSAERHARSYIYKAKDDFDPHFRTDISRSVKLMAPVFEGFYQEGKKDRAAGMSLADAKTKTTELVNNESHSNSERYHIFMGKSYSMGSDAKKEKLLIKECIDAYWDGFNNN